MVEIRDCLYIADHSVLTTQTHRIFADLVSAGCALGWVNPPGQDEISLLVKNITEEARDGNAAIYAAMLDRIIVGIGYWRRYRRPTHYPHADIERIAVDARWQGRGIGRRLTETLIESATLKGIEVLTLDVRGDNTNAIRLYEHLGFEEYGVLRKFVAIGTTRYDKHFLALDLRKAREAAPHAASLHAS